jgi:hypothetical protein
VRENYSDPVDEPGPIAFADASAFHLRCGWCQLLMREAMDADAPTTTGICPPCAAQFEREIQIVAQHRRAAGSSVRTPARHSRLGK